MSFVPQPTEVLLQNVRVSYCHLLEPWANSTQPGAKPRYSATILSKLLSNQLVLNSVHVFQHSQKCQFMMAMDTHNLVRSLVLNVKVIGCLQQHKMLAIKLKQQIFKVILSQILHKYTPACMSMYSFDSSSTPINPLVSDVVWALFKKYAMVKRWVACQQLHPLYLARLKVAQLMYILVLQQQVNLCNNKHLNKVMYNRYMLRHLSNLYNKLLQGLTL